MNFHAVKLSYLIKDSSNLSICYCIHIYLQTKFAASVASVSYHFSSIVSLPLRRVQRVTQPSTKWQSARGYNSQCSFHCMKCQVIWWLQFCDPHLLLKVRNYLMRCSVTSFAYHVDWVYLHIAWLLKLHCHVVMFG